MGIKKYNIKTLPEAVSCKELWDVKNGITLCYGCHNLIERGNIIKNGN